MSSKELSGNYEIKILLSDRAWANENYLKRIESGELEDIISEARGVIHCWKGVDRKYQNVPTVDSFENAISLVNKLNELPYVCEITLSKVDLKSRFGYIPVKK